MASKKRTDDDFDPNDAMNSEDTAIATRADAAAMAAFDPAAFTIDSDAFAEMLQRGEAAMEQVLILAPGKGIKGELVGYGGDILCNDPMGPTEKNPSGKRAVKSYRVKITPKVTAILMDCSQLATSLPPLFGKKVAILRGPKVQVGSRMVNRYFVSEVL